MPLLFGSILKYRVYYIRRKLFKDIDLIVEVKLVYYVAQLLGVYLLYDLQLIVHRKEGEHFYGNCLGQQSVADHSALEYIVIIQ